MKVLGSVMILLCGAAIGLKRVEELKRRVNLLRDWDCLIQSFSAEMSYSAKPLGELIRQGKESRFCAAAVLQREFARSPKAALLAAGEQLLRRPADLELFRGFVHGLGESDLQGQAAHCRLYTALLQKNLAQAEEDREKRSRLCLCLSSFGALLVCLVLW